MTDFIQSIGDQSADFRILSGNRRDLRDLFLRVSDVRFHIVELFTNLGGSHINAALQLNRIRARSHIA